MSQAKRKTLKPGTPDNFVSYVSSVQRLAMDVLSGLPLPREQIAALLDGAPSRNLRALVPLSDRRAQGAFFTTSAIRDGPFSAELPPLPTAPAALDAACGAGDLLLRWADRLPVHDTLEETIGAWNPYLHGTDLDPTFIRLAQARLVLSAASRTGPGTDKLQLANCFPGLAVGDGLERLAQSPVNWTLLNPPFGASASPDWQTSTRGAVSSAATFVSAWLRHVRPGDRLIAILPEVLRSGTRYARWRQEVEDSTKLVVIKPLGQFDADVDIDVFLLHAEADGNQSTAPEASWWPTAREAVVGPTRPSFRVSVGAVVPHRAPEAGPSVPFVTARTLPQKAEIDPPLTRRRFSGTLEAPPFVAVRRTSRPGQVPRARTTIVTGIEPIAVENHIIVVKPVKGGLQACRSVATLLEHADTTAWLDDRLRGRHLTTAALRELLGEQGE